MRKMLMAKAGATFNLECQVFLLSSTLQGLMTAGVCCSPDGEATGTDLEPSFPGMGIRHRRNLGIVLSLYRLTLGQARQEDQLNHVSKNFDNPEFLKELFIDLSPYAHKKL